MLVKTEWHQIGRIIIQAYAEEVSLADMEEGWQAVATMLEADARRLPIHIIVDFTQRKSYSVELFNLPTMRRLFDLSSQNTRLAWMIAVQSAPHPVMLFTSTLAARLTGHKFRVVGNLEEALRYLRFTDSSLVEPPENP
jgi:hypothetical protein